MVMKSKKIIWLCVIAVLSVSWVSPAALLAAERYSGRITNPCPDQTNDQATEEPVSQNTNSISNQEDALICSDGGKLYIILLPDWRGGDRTIMPLLIRLILRPKHINFNSFVR
jgi:hypothetical protein